VRGFGERRGGEGGGEAAETWSDMGRPHESGQEYCSASDQTEAM
jgi:hypothetical protein